MTTIEAIATCRRFMPSQQIAAMIYGMRGEERQFFVDKFLEMAERFLAMPATYEQDGLGDAAIVSLHYFAGGADWYITERDVETADEPGQHQAFGLADLFRDGGELGYISILELIRNNVEVDLYFAPRTLGECRKVSR